MRRLALIAALILLAAPQARADPQPGDSCLTANQDTITGGVENSGIRDFLICSATSPSSWTSAPAVQETNAWDSITYGNGQFVAVSNNGTTQVMTSPDGITWTARTAPAGYHSGIAYGNGTFAVWGGAMTSPDGITWTAQSPFYNSASAIAFGNNTFVVVLTGGSVYTSPDGITWTSQTSGMGNGFYAITYGNGLFVAVGSGTTYVATSPDGITWTAQTAPVTDLWRGVTYGNGLFVAVGINGHIITSPNAITWTSRTNSTAYWSAVTYGNGLFVAVGSNANGPVGLATSPDGITWTTQTSPAAGNWWDAVAYGNGRFVALSNNGTNQVMTSTGTSWQSTVRLAAGGNVGIGNTAPGSTLDIGNAGSTLGTLRLEGSGSGYVQLQPSSSAGSWTATLPGSAGANTNVLTTNGSGVLSWSAVGGVASSALSGISAAAATHTIDNTNKRETMTWNSLTTGTALTLSSTSMTTGTLLSVTDTSASGSSDTTLNVATSDTGNGAQALLTVRACSSRCRHSILKR